jgi:hypothetical protein
VKSKVSLENLTEFVNALASRGSDVAQTARLRRGLSNDDPSHIGMLYCPICSGYSGMKLDTLYFESTVGKELYSELVKEDTLGFGRTSRQKPLEYSDPSLFRLSCVNCPNTFYVLVYKNETGPKLLNFSVRGGGVATPNTPPLVRYYLEQAYKAQSATAYSAALTMYRAALEQLLEDKGFNGGLASKLNEFESKVVARTAPSWAMRQDAEILTVFKEISKSHAHPNELKRLQAIDSQFMSKVQQTFASLLRDAYELEPRKEAANAKIAAALAKAKKKANKSK